MATILTDVRTRVKRKLDDLDFSDAVLADFANDTQRELFNTVNFPFNQETATLTLAADASTVALPDDFQRIENLRVTDPQNDEMDITRHFLPYAKFRSVYWDATSTRYSKNRPLYWTLYENGIQFAWQADREYTLTLDYTKAPATLADGSDNIAIPDEWSEIIVLGMLVRALEHNDDYDLAQIQQRKYDKQVSAMINRYHPQQIGKPRIMRNSRRGI